MTTYSILYADPPWAYRVWSKKGAGRSAEAHYPTMPVEGIAALPVRDLAAPDSVLLLWATAPCLEQAFAVIRAWGFTYKTMAFVWVKTRKGSAGTLFFDGSGFFMGMGHYTRANAEFVLLATRGGGLPRESRAVRSLVVAPVGEHSAKPPEVRRRIVELFGDLPRIELFARESAPGWAALGNALDGRDIRAAIREQITPGHVDDTAAGNEEQP